MDVLLFIGLNVAALVLIAALVVWLRFRVEDAPRMPPWIPAIGIVMAGGLATVAFLTGLPLVGISSALNVVVFSMLLWNAQRLRAR